MIMNTTFPYELQAKRQEETPHGLDLTDQKFFLSLRLLYGQYQLGILDRARASDMKRRLVAAWEKDKELDALNRKTAGLWRALEPYAAAYAKERTLENADRFYAEVFHLGPNWRKDGSEAVESL